MMNDDDLIDAHITATVKCPTSKPVPALAVTSKENATSLSSSSSPSSSSTSSGPKILDAAISRELSNYCQQRGIIPAGMPSGAVAVDGTGSDGDVDSDGEWSGSERSAATDEGTENNHGRSRPPGATQLKRGWSGGAPGGVPRRVLGPSAVCRVASPAGPAGAAIAEAIVGTGLTLVKSRSQYRRHSAGRSSSFTSVISDGGTPQDSMSQRSPSVTRSSVYDSDDVLSLDDASVAASESDGPVEFSPARRGAAGPGPGPGPGLLGCLEEQPETADDAAPASVGRQVRAPGCSSSLPFPATSTLLPTLLAGPCACHPRSRSTVATR